jgi:hypothetical protein
MHGLRTNLLGVKIMALADARADIIGCLAIGSLPATLGLSLISTINPRVGRIEPCRLVPNDYIGRLSTR